jgi:uncharacterized protein YraI
MPFIYLLLIAAMMFPGSALTESATVNTPGDGFLSLRSEPSASRGVRLLKVPHGTALELGACKPNPGGANWCQSSYLGQTGWVLDKYLTLSTAPLSNRNAGIAKPVMIGDDPFSNDCGVGVVVGLKAGGDGFLAVRQGPNAQAPQIDQLYAGNEVNMCDISPDERWTGIIYSRDPAINCDISNMISPRQPYQGRCQSGWVSSRWLELIRE